MGRNMHRQEGDVGLISNKLASTQEGSLPAVPGTMAPESLALSWWLFLRWAGLVWLSWRNSSD